MMVDRETEEPQPAASSKTMRSNRGPRPGRMQKCIAGII